MRGVAPLGSLMAVCFVCVATSATWGQTRTVSFGTSGMPWMDVAEQVIGLEDSTANGALQPFFLDPDKNILVGPRTELDELTNIFNLKWSLNKVGRGSDFVLGVNPRFWTATWSSIYHGGPRPYIDGDPYTVNKVIGVRAGSGGRDQLYTFDFGFPLAINRVVFYPPDRGVDEKGGLMKQRFPRAYEVSATSDPESYLLLSEEREYHTLDRLIARTFFNGDRIVDLRFPTQIMRFLRISFNLIDQSYLLGEIEVYGEGFPPVTSYRTQVIDLGREVNIGRISWKFEKFRYDPIAQEIESAPDAPIELTLETRSGKDDTPKSYHIVSEIGTQQRVEKSKFDLAPESSIRLGARPGDKGEISEDTANWSPWSTPYKQSGTEVRSPDGRRYFQFRYNSISEDFMAFGRMDSIAIEVSPLLVEKIIGEVGLVDGEFPPGIHSAPAGVEVPLLYAIKAVFGAQGNRGFNVIRINTISDAEFIGLEIGNPGTTIVPDSVRSQNGMLEVYFPSNKVQRNSGEEEVRLIFRASMLSYSTHFLAEIEELNGETLAQSVEPGDATTSLASDDIRIYVEEKSIEVLSSFVTSARHLTPNGDGVNDLLHLRYTLLSIDEGMLHIEVLNLLGESVRSVEKEPQRKGIYTRTWDGRDDRGVLVSPGVYLIKASVETNKGNFTKILPVALAY